MKSKGTSPIPYVLFAMAMILPSLLLCQTYYAPVTTKINTPYGTVHSTSYTPMHMAVPGGSQGLSSPTMEYLIVSTDDHTKMVTGAINIYDSINSITYKDTATRAKQKIVPGETKAIYAVRKLNNQRIEGIPADSCWYFKVASGKINSYSIVPMASKYVFAIQVGDGPIMALNKENLLAIMGDDPELVALINKDKLQKAVTGYNKKHQ